MVLFLGRVDLSAHFGTIFVKDFCPKKRENGGKGYPNRFDQNSSHAIKRGKGR